MTNDGGQKPMWAEMLCHISNAHSTNGESSSFTFNALSIGYRIHIGNEKSITWFQRKGGNGCRNIRERARERKKCYTGTRSNTIYLKHRFHPPCIIMLMMTNGEAEEERAEGGVVAGYSRITRAVLAPLVLDRI